ncbi:MAG: thiamine biosynthesis protein, partial [Nitrosopumilaceae archaeon]
MKEEKVVVVFPSLFSLNKIESLLSNLKKILKTRGQKFGRIQKDDSVIVIHANDEVAASSIINSIFGIERIAIAKKIDNKFNLIISTITKIGSSVLLRGEKFYVKAEGHSSTYLPKDIELAATSSLIEKTTDLQVKPGTEDNHDRLLYTHLTKSSAYICIFVDKGSGGIPYNSQKEQTVCCVHDEFSAISCLQTIKMGF